MPEQIRPCWGAVLLAGGLQVLAVTYPPLAAVLRLLRGAFTARS